MHLKQRTIALFFLLVLGGLGACTGEILTESTPIPPPPNADNDEGTDAAVDATALPSPLPLLEEEETAVQP
ncbi:MAG: hypothetical protein WAS33_01175, partial [Candidatus Promineifilaceae bacterium]